MAAEGRGSGCEQESLPPKIKLVLTSVRMNTELATSSFSPGSCWSVPWFSFSSKAALAEWTPWTALWLVQSDPMHGVSRPQGHHWCFGQSLESLEIQNTGPLEMRARVLPGLDSRLQFIPKTLGNLLDFSGSHFLGSAQRDSRSKLECAVWKPT